MPEEKKAVKSKVQNLYIENRHKISITGVLEVISFNDESVIIDTELGILIIRGDNLKINKLNVESSELSIEGDFYCCEYDDKDSGRSKGSGFFARMFK